MLKVFSSTGRHGSVGLWLATLVCLLGAYAFAGLGRSRCAALGALLVL